MYTSSFIFICTSREETSPVLALAEHAEGKVPILSSASTQTHMGLSGSLKSLKKFAKGDNKKTHAKDLEDNVLGYVTFVKRTYVYEKET